MKSGLLACFLAGLIASTLFAAQIPAPTSLPVSDPKKPSRDELRAYAADAEKELRGGILPFWLAHARDGERGGFYGRISQDMRISAEAPRGSLLTSRILWTFSAASRRFHDPAYLDMARWAWSDLKERQWDREHGGLFWTTAPGGMPVDTTKLIYAQAFGIYGLAEYHRATGDREALERAIELYRLVESKARDRKDGGYFEAFTRDWVRNDDGQRIMGPVFPKSQNTHIHILEAYTNLFRVWPDDALRKDLGALLEVMLTHIVNPQTHHLVLYFKADWTPAAEEVSYGHDIELSWLIAEAAEVLGDRTLLAKVQDAALPMAAVTAAEGVDSGGGVTNERGANGLVNTNRDWWPQAEAAVGFLNAYQVSGDPAYYAASRRSWAFIQATLVDRKNGEWYEAVSHEGTPLNGRSKLSVWKCPYHNSRACLELMDRLEKLAGAAK